MKKPAFFRPLAQTSLSQDWGRLTKHTYELKRSDGTWQRQTRETYDRGNGAACLLYNPDTDTVLLTRQFRLPAFINGHDGFLIEVPAGLIDGLDPAERMRAELEEETGFAVSDLTLVFDAFTSPGSVTERIACFTGTYDAGSKVAEGGGKKEEGEDIEVLHVNFDHALAMVRSGEITDAKTIMLLQHMALKQTEAPAK